MPNGLSIRPSPAPPRSRNLRTRQKNASYKRPSSLRQAAQTTPRASTFLMHILTSALCISSLLSIIPDPVHKAQLLQGYARSSALFVLLRGRPRINIPLLMSYTEFPRPPAHAPPGGPDALGGPNSVGETNPWLAIVQNALHHKDAHVLKVVRTLYYCALKYGGKVAGSAIGARDEKGAWMGRFSCVRRG
ncbi:hypothetical protein C8R45DRAFT_628702 [Mycena sanguinolenta]|nr:hypothetical protein C8R45DRAFT_628702 [Mycena sanguinolenta]